MKISVKPRCLGFRVLLITVLILCHVMPAEAKNITIQFPEEQLSTRLRKIGEQGDADILFDLKEVSTTRIPALNASNLTVEQALERTLSGTAFTWKKTAETSYAVLKKETPSAKPQRSGSGTLKGRIVESETSEPIPGAAIRLSDKQYAVSDMSGYYTFPKVAGGKYTLEVSYVGFKPEKTEITVRAGENTYDIKLSGSTTLGEVQVRGIQRVRGSVPHTTEKLLVAEIKGLSVLASGISSEQISKTTDRNAAEVAQRIAGVTTVDDKFVIVRGLNQRYNLTYLNDNVAPSTETNSRAFAMDLIPSRIIDKIMVYKSPSPENQGDATGGVVKIYTKDAKNVKHFDIEFQAGIRPGTSFNDNFLTYKGGKTDFLGFDDGTRALPSSVPGYGSLVRAQLSPSEYAKTFNPTLYYGKKTALPNMQFTTNYYNAFKVFGKLISSLTSFSYKNEAQKSDVYRQQGLESIYVPLEKTSTEDRNTATVQMNLLQNFTLNLNENNRIFFKNFLLQQGIDGTTVRISRPTFDTNMFSKDKDIILSYNQRFLYAGNLGGTHYFNEGKHNLNWNAGYNYSRQETPDQRVIRLTGTTEASAIGDYNLQWQARGFNGYGPDENPVPLALGIISRIWSRSSEGIYNFSLDYTYNPAPWVSVKTGTFNQWKERQLDRRIYTVHEGYVDDPDVSYGLAPGPDRYTDPELTRFHEQDLPNVWSETYLRNDLSGLRVQDRTSGSDTYRGTEQNNSGYLMLNLTPFHSKLEISGGLRFEFNRQKIAAAIPPVYGGYGYGINEPVLIDNSARSWLPSLNVSWRPSDNFVVRGAYGKTVNRTEFREVSPFQEMDFENNTILSGNPDLKSATAANYDTRVEFYPRGNKGDAISAGIFYKEITDPIERINTTNRVESQFPQISYRNASSATIKGVEIELRKSLDFISGTLFRNLSVIGNVSFIKSVTKDTTNIYNQNYTAAGRPLQGQAPYIINTGVYYDNAGSGTKLSLVYNVSGMSIYATGRGYVYNGYTQSAQYQGSLLELPRHLLDFSFTQRIYKSVQLKLGIQNILNQSVQIAEDYNFTNKYEPLKTNPNVINKFLKPEQTGDNISSRYNPGRYFTLTLSYSL